MTIHAAGWRAIEDEKEKYQAYLCSREWSVLKERVRTRSGGVCERCFSNKMQQVHHLTYARKYNERLDDLQAICRGCHEFVHAKSKVDPASGRPAYVNGRQVFGFYLAGKITGATWRGEIVSGWETQNHSDNYRRCGVYESDGDRWDAVANAAQVKTGVFLDYLGPWWRATSVWGGHASSNSTMSPHCYTEERQDYDNHGNLFTSLPSQEDRELARSQVSRLVREAVQSADMVFAWIESDDCLGTMLEIGMARGLGKLIVVASPTGFDGSETWLASSVADFSVRADSAGAAWKYFWENLRETAVASRRLDK